MFKPQIYQLPKLKDDIMESDASLTKSRYQALPLFKYGFTYFMHQSKDKMEILNDPMYKPKRFPTIINAFEDKIPDEENDLSNATIKYFQIKKEQPPILSRAFYKLWEIIITFNLIDTESGNFVSAHLAEGPGSFIQSTMFYREKFCKSSGKCKHYAVTLHCEQKDVPPFHQKFIDYYQKSNKFFQHKTFSRAEADKNKKKDCGDLTQMKTIKNFSSEVKKAGGADFITADGGFYWQDENYQEQEAYRLILGEMIAAISMQNKGGHFVCKIFDIFTETTIKFLCILQQFYDNVFIHKPLMSRASNSEKYIVCQGFMHSQGAKLNKMIKNLEKLLEEMNNVELKEKMYVDNVFPNFEIPETYQTVIKSINIELNTIQYQQLNKILEFINSKNYFGSVYHGYLEQKRAATAYWLKHYYPLSEKDLEESQKVLQKQTMKIIKDNREKAQDLHQITK